MGQVDQEVGFIQVEAMGNVAPGRDAFKKSLTELLFTSERDEEGGRGRDAVLVLTLSPCGGYSTVVIA